MLRIQRGVAETLTHTFYVGETATNPTPDTCTITITKADGTAYLATTPAAEGGTGVFTYALPGVATLERLTVAWAATFDAQTRTELDYLEVVGGFYFTLAELRASDDSLADAAKYTTAELREARAEVEEECERICELAFVPRFRRVRLSGNGGSTLLLPDSEPRTIRSLREYSDGDTFTSYSAGELADIALDPSGQIFRAGGGTFAKGTDNLVAEYEHGLDAPPGDLRRAALVRARLVLNLHRSSVPDRATSFQVEGGNVYRLDTAGAHKTGYPQIDGVYQRYSRRVPGFA